MVGKKMLPVMALVLILGACGVNEMPIGSSSDTLPEASYLFLETELLEEEGDKLTEELQEKARGAIVQIVCGNLSGSGVIFSMDQEQVMIITAAHVLEGMKDREEVRNDGLEIKLANGTLLTESEAESSRWQIRLSQTSDIGFITLPVEAFSRESFADCRFVPVDKKTFDQLQPGDTLLILGSVEMVADKVCEGRLWETWIYIEDYGQYMMLGRIDAQPGMSGCGVFDRFGRLIGILSGEDEKGNLAIVPLSLILSEL